MTQKFGVHSGQSFYNPLTSVTRLGKNLPLWQNFKSLFIFVSLFRIWQNIKPTLIIILCLWTNFIIDKGPILKKVYSHLVTLIPSPVGEKNLGEKSHLSMSLCLFTKPLFTAPVRTMDNLN